MNIQLNSKDLKLLEQEGVHIIPGYDYTEDEAFELLDQVHDIEIRYAQDSDTDANARMLANAYASVADKIQNAIPEV